MPVDTVRKEMKQSIRAYGIPYVLELVAELCRQGEKYWDWSPSDSEQWGRVAAKVEEARDIFRK